MEIEVVRIGQRVVRDDRVTTHVALVARSFGANKIYMNEVNSERVIIPQEHGKNVVTNKTTD